MRTPGKNKRALLMASGLLSAGAFVAGCGVSVAAGHDNAATNPASGIFVSNTVGGGATSERSLPTVTYELPPSKPPSSLPPGQSSTVKAIESAVTGGCWQDSHTGNGYGAYDQLFWYMGACGDTVAGVTIELYPSAAKAKAEADHTVGSPLMARYLDGAALVDVWSGAPVSAPGQLASVKSLQAVPGYSD